MKKIIVSTDNSATAKIFGFLAAEVDDSLALAVLLDAHKHKEIELVGITSTFGNVDGETVFKITQKQVRLSGQNIPVIKGAMRPGESNPTVVSFIRRQIERTKEGLTLVALGPVTDYAAVFKEYLALKKKVKEFLLVRSGPYLIKKYWYMFSFNAKADVEGANYMYRLGANQFSMGEEIFQVGFNNNFIRRLQNVEHPMMKFITRDLIRWNFQNKFFPDKGYFVRGGNMCPRDLVWSMYLVEPKLFDTRKCHDHVELHITNTKIFANSVATRLMRWSSAEVH